jgi:hypothetical protein
MFTDTAEIITDLESRQLAQRMKALLREIGWVEGKTSSTPNRARLVAAGRTRSPSYYLHHNAAQPDHWMSLLAREHDGRIACLTDHFVEWVRGSQIISLDVPPHDRAEEGASGPNQQVPTPASDTVTPLQTLPPERDLGLHEIVDSLCGPPLEGRREAEEATLLDFYRPFDERFRSSLEVLFSRVIDLVTDGQPVAIEGFARFARRAATAGHAIDVSVDPALIDCVNGGIPPRIALEPRLREGVSSKQIARFEAQLRRVCARLRDHSKDVLLGAGLAVTAVPPPHDWRRRVPRRKGARLTEKTPSFVSVDQSLVVSSP